MSASKSSKLAIQGWAKQLAAFAVSFVFCIAALPSFAQQQPASPSVPAAPYGYGPMMWGWRVDGPGWGWHPFMIVGPIFGLFALIGIMAIFVWLVRWATHGHPFHGHDFHHFHGERSRTALDILEERFARGEIDKAEFEDKRKLLSR
ncbi:MAG TPA: SHOCT domain-containing protein [Candidatus Udaeobacter sp.]|nr:SHOCT domain-containing protein [Candidatus Udaeobacter sp.]